MKNTLFMLLMLGVAPSALHAETLDVGIIGDVKSTEFATKHDDNTMMLLHQILEGLVAYDDKLEVAPQLAKSWDVSEDGRVYTFHLRPGVKFHNGQPLTSREVQWNWSRFLDPKRDWGSHCREQIDGGFEEYLRPAYVTNIEAPDPMTVRFTLQSPSAMFLHHLASNHCVYGIAHPDSVDQQGNWLKPIGTGPYKLESRVPGRHVTLTKFNGYSRSAGKASGLAGTKEALADKVILHVLPSAEAARQGLANRSLDLVPNIPVADAAAYDALAGVDTKVQVTPAFFQLIAQSRTDPLLRDPQMRRAIAHAIDRDRLVKEVFGGIVQSNPSVVAQTTPYYGPAHRKTLPYDPALAKRLAGEAGYRGEELEIVASGDPYPPFLSAARSAAAMLRESGINAKVTEVDWGEHDRRYGANEYQLTTIAFSSRTQPTLMYSAMVGQKGDHAWYVWEDQEAEHLVTETAVVADPEVQKANYERLHNKMIEWSPTVGLSNYPRVDAVRQVPGYSGWTLAIPRFWKTTD